MSLYEQLIGEADKMVDDYLGDSIWYKRDGETEFTKISGFFPLAEPGGYEPSIDDIAVRTLCKIQIALIPEIKRGDRLKRGETDPIVYQPILASLTQEGRYWLFNIQKV